jgi:hypothetical protein
VMSSAVLERESISFWGVEDFDAVDPQRWLMVAAQAPAVRADEASHSDDSRDHYVRDLVLRSRFNVLADQLADDTAGISSTRRMVRHPAYVGILLMGQDAVPYLVERLQTGEHRPTWLKLLGSLTSLPPSAGQETIEGSTNAWLRWAKSPASRL